MASLGNDLAAIRKEQDLSIEDLQGITKLDLGILRSIEDDSIFENARINNTYVRSYVRNYAKAVHIEESKIVRALNQAQADTYNGELEPPSPQKSDASENNLKEAEGETKGENSDMIHDHSPKYSSEDSSKDVAKRPAKAKAISTEKNTFTNWATIGKKAKPAKKKPSIPPWLLITLLAAVFLVLILLLYNYFSNGSIEADNALTPTAIEQPVIPQDSLQESLLVNENGSQSEFPITAAGPLPDTLSITVVAASGKLEPVRVYTDIMEIRRPYWIELGDSMRFEFVNIFRVRATDQFDRMKLLLDEKEIDNYYRQYYNTESGMVELSRAIIEETLPLNNSPNRASNISSGNS